MKIKRGRYAKSTAKTKTLSSYFSLKLSAHILHITKEIVLIKCY
jgi:hypothetical protein